MKNVSIMKQITLYVNKMKINLTIFSGTYILVTYF